MSKARPRKKSTVLLLEVEFPNIKKNTCQLPGPLFNHLIQNKYNKIIGAYVNFVR